MKMTPQLKAWVIANCEVSEDTTDDDLRKAAGIALVNGMLTVEKLTELTAEIEEKEADEFSKKLDAMATGLEKLAAVLTASQEKQETPETKEQNVGKVIADGAKEGTVRVKGAHEQYSNTKSAAFFPKHTPDGKSHPMAGKPMSFYSSQRQMDTPSDLDKAVAGAYGQFIVECARNKGNRSLSWMQMPQHSKELLQYAMENMRWSGSSNGGDEADIIDRKLTPTEQKALIDDAASGGLEALSLPLF